MDLIKAIRYINGYILLIVAIAKFISAAGQSKVLSIYDPVLGFEFRYLLLFAGALELLAGLVCISKKSDIVAMGLVAVVSTNIALYRVGLYLTNWHRPCSCMGSLTDMLHIPPQNADSTMKIILIYLLVSSYATLFWFWAQKKRLAVVSK